MDSLQLSFWCELISWICCATAETPVPHIRSQGPPANRPPPLAPKGNQEQIQHPGVAPEAQPHKSNPPNLCPRGTRNKYSTIAPKGHSRQIHYPAFARKVTCNQIHTSKLGHRSHPQHVQYPKLAPTRHTLKKEYPKFMHQGNTSCSPVLAHKHSPQKTTPQLKLQEATSRESNSKVEIRLTQVENVCRHAFKTNADLHT